MKTDYHIHTNLCDGKNSPEEMVLSAIERDFDILGFSGHSFTDFDNSYCMSKENTKVYYKTITTLKEKYKDKIKILCGLELDYYASKPEIDVDYTIGSVHYLKFEDEYIPVDHTKEIFTNLLNEKFDGNFDALAEAYYSNVGDVLEKTNADIIGHFDLVSKFNEVCGYGESERYLKAAFKAVEKLIPYNKPFEINVGAMTRGYRSSPYPSENILSEINRLGGKIMITGDCHNKEGLGDLFDEAKMTAKRCGFKTALYLSEEGFIEYDL